MKAAARGFPENREAPGIGIFGNRTVHQAPPKGHESRRAFLQVWLFLFLYQENGRQGADQQQIGVEQIPYDIKGGDGVAHFGGGGDGNQNLRAVGDNALENAGEGVQQAGGTFWGDAVIPAHFFGDGVRHDDGDGVVGGGDIHGAHQQAHTKLAAFFALIAEAQLSYLQRDFIKQVWSPENPGAYFPRPMANSAISGTLSYVNNRYLQNIRYLRFKNLTAGYTIPSSITRKAGIENIRIYFTGENLAYWSPIKKHSKYVDPEAAFTRTSSNQKNRIYYPWAKTYMFGIDVTF